jgi:D-ribose pyranose/furanose isomerase RbsD
MMGPVYILDFSPATAAGSFFDALWHEVMKNNTAEIRKIVRTGDLIRQGNGCFAGGYWRLFSHP